MHLFHWNTLLYLSFHLVGFFFCFVSTIGIPGDVDDTKPMVKKVSKVFSFLFFLAWCGIPVLLLCSVAAFYFEWTTVGILFSTISMSLGLGVFFCLVTLYNIK